MLKCPTKQVAVIRISRCAKLNAFYTSEQLTNISKVPDSHNVPEDVCK